VSVRRHRLLTTGFGLLAAVLCLSSRMACADESISYATIGTQTMGLAIGPFFPIRVAPSQSSKLFGTAVMPSWCMTITDPIGSKWYRGQVALGAELLVFGTSEPVTG
jgi:lipid A 3-O-deacylase